MSGSKPSAEVAAEYLAGGHHLWNLGLFAWPARFFMAELERADPQLAAALQRIVEARVAGDEAAAGELYAAQANVPVEPLVLERTARLTVVQASFTWSDLGSWADLHLARSEAGEADAAGNVSGGDALLVESQGCTVESRGGRLVAVAGAEDLVVVDTPDALLVVPRAQSQRVKEVVDRLRAEGRTTLL